MKTDPAALFGEYIAALRVPGPPPVSRLTARAHRRRSGAWLAPVFAALAVIALLFVPLGGYGRPSPAPQVAEGSQPSLPERFASYSYFTGYVSQSPPGPAIALYQQGWNVELADFPQGLVLGAYSDVYRRVDLADDREDSDDQGEPAPMLLSADGARVAVGSHEGRGDLELLDLRTGDVRRVAASGGQAVRPLAWSRDGSHLAAIELGAGASNQTFGGRLVIFDLASGETQRPPDFSSVSAAAFAPGGQELAVQQDGIHIIDLDGRRLRTLVSSGPPYLTSESAWSPDGSALAVRMEEPRNSGQYSAVFLDPTGRRPTVHDPVADIDHNGIVGWTGPDRLLTRTRQSLQEVDIRTGDRRQLAEFDTTGGNFAMARIQFAANLLLEMGLRPAGEPDRGPWPTWWRNTLAITMIITVAGVTFLVRRYLFSWRKTVPAADSQPAR